MTYNSNYYCIICMLNTLSHRLEFGETPRTGTPYLCVYVLEKQWRIGPQARLSYRRTVGTCRPKLNVHEHVDKMY